MGLREQRLREKKIRILETVDAYLRERGEDTEWFTAAEVATWSGAPTAQGISTWLSWIRVDDLVEITADGRQPHLWRITEKGRRRLQEQHQGQRAS